MPLAPAHPQSSRPEPPPGQARPPVGKPAWWERPGLGYDVGGLRLGPATLAALAEREGTPLYVYDSARVLDNLARLRAALAAAVPNGRVFYAMKANRHPLLLRKLRTRGRCGVDVCSPGELLLARDMGFRERDISYTGTSMSAADATVLAAHPQIVINCDSRSALRRIATVAPGRAVGLRINPALGIGYRQNPRLTYAGGGGTKFGIPWADVPAAVAEAKALGLKFDGIHFHAGCGWLTPQLPLLDRILGRMARVVAALGPLRYVNIGGGLGIPLVKGDRPLDLAAWARVVAKHFGSAAHEVWMEPGDYLVKDSGVLLLEVTEVEEKAGVRYVGVNGGFNLHPEPVFYSLPLEPVPLQPRAGGRRKVTLAGNINEAHDVWSRDVRLPVPEPGDGLGFLNAGGYGAAMASDHCRRGEWREVVV